MENEKWIKQNPNPSLMICACVNGQLGNCSEWGSWQVCLLSLPHHCRVFLLLWKMCVGVCPYWSSPWGWGWCSLWQRGPSLLSCQAHCQWHFCPSELRFVYLLCLLSLWLLHDLLVGMSVLSPSTSSSSFWVLFAVFAFAFCLVIGAVASGDGDIVLGGFWVVVLDQGAVLSLYTMILYTIWSCYGDMHVQACTQC